MEEKKTSERAAIEIIGTGSLFNTSKAIKAYINPKNASQVSYMVGKHIRQAIYNAEARFNVLFAMEATKIPNSETESQLGGNTLERSHNLRRDNVTSPPSKTWWQEMVEEDPHNQPWHGLALGSMPPDERATVSSGLASRI